MSNQRSSQETSQTVRGSKKGGGARISGAGFAQDQASGTVSTITSQVQGALDQQIIRGAIMMTNVAQSARRAADELETDSPQVAGLVRGVADQVEQYSRSLENQSVTDLYQAASDFTRRQPAVVFGIAALAGFFALRTLKSSSTSSRSGSRGSQSREFRGEFHGS
jgi:hypothetical protein